MWCLPTKKHLEKLPPLYSTEMVKTKDKKIKMHFFIGSADWYITEFDGDDTFFGYADHGQGGEWGYISFNELKSLKVRGIEVDRDKYWKIRKFGDI